MKFSLFIFSLVCFAFLYSCSGISDSNNKNETSVKFNLLSPEESGIDFSNILDEVKMKDPFSYVNSYNGGGVGIGDINNDGLMDVVLTGNFNSTKLYLNKGDLKFEDITEKAGIRITGWVTSVAMADVNNDGWLDLYFCRSYDNNSNDRKNQLYLNKKDTPSAKLEVKLELMMIIIPLEQHFLIMISMVISI